MLIENEFARRRNLTDKECGFLHIKHSYVNCIPFVLNLLHFPYVKS